MVKLTNQIHKITGLMVLEGTSWGHLLGSNLLKQAQLEEYTYVTEL